VPSNQDRLAALWKAIARRYQNETQIAGYDLLNEPTPSVSVSLWKNLAQRIIDSIRTVDKQHLVIAERAIALGCNYGFNDGNYNFQPLQEENLMYTVHMYDPFEFTHQYQGFVGTGEGGKYPDENAISAPSDVSWAYGQYNNPSVPMGTSNWTYYQGVPFQVNNDSAIIARPVFYGHRLKNGVAYFDDIVIHEVDAQGNILREIAKLNFTNNTNIWFWSEKNDGTLGTSTDGHNDNFSLTVTGTSGYSSVTIQPLQFKVEKGKWYAASAWMKGENLPTGITVNTTMEFYYSPSKQKVKARNATTLREMILAATRFPRERNFPVYYGEFGAGRPCFVNDKGGDRWTKDVIYIFDSLDFHFTYHAYREDNFGYYGGWEGPLDTSTVQQSLKKVFEEYFIQSPTGAEMQNITEEIGIAVYPNPASHLICFENRNQKMANVQISDTKGKVLKTITLAGNETTELEIKDLTRGMYFCLLHQDGQKRTFKLVKE
jgi:endoglucanase